VVQAALGSPGGAAAAAMAHSGQRPATAPCVSWAYLLCSQPRCLQVFSHFDAPAAALDFFVPLTVLLEAIATVASSVPHELHLQYPGPDNSLLLT